MNGKQRMIAAMEGRVPDRIPIMIVAYSGFYAHCAGRQQWQFDYGTGQAQLEMQVTSARHHPENDALYTWTGMNRGPLEGIRLERTNGQIIAHYPDGRSKLADDNPANGLWNWPVEWVRGEFERNRIASEADLDRVLPLVTADQLLHQREYRVLPDLAKAIGQERLLCVNHSSLFATAANYLGGIEEAWMRTISETPPIEAVLDRVLAIHVEHVKAVARAGGHALWHAYMYEGANMMRSEVWRRLLKPRNARIVEEAHRLGLKDIAWFLDDPRPLVQDLIDIGTDALSTESPRGAYECDPGVLRRLAGDNLCIFGWLKDMDLINGNREAIRHTLEKHYREAGDGKPFVVATPGITQEVAQDTVHFILEEALKLRV